ncbi:MAG: HAD-IA family hydrolase [Clostridia bacterium]|nr:HAD-IA family hydrolase [Clostridia bacterium]
MKNSEKKIKTVLWDLDGTLLDTLDDLTDSVNYVLRKYSLPERTKDQVRSFVGVGSAKLIERSTGLEHSDERLEEIHSQYKKYYNAHSAVKTKPYPGITELVKKLKEAGIRSCVVSNKPDVATVWLVRHYFGDLFDFVTGARDGFKHKPAPDIVDFALKTLGADKNSSVFIGDSEIDVLTARNAGTEGIAVSWGFRSEKQLKDAGAKTVCPDAASLEKYLLQNKTENGGEKKMEYVVRTKKAPAETAAIASINWLGYRYKPACTARLVYDEGKGFEVTLVCREANPLARYKGFYEPVWTDSCMEFFANFAPQNTDNFFNLEMNSAGGWLFGFGPERDGREPLGEIAKKWDFAPKAKVFSDHWQVSAYFKLGMLFELFGEFDPKPGYTFRGNFFKCGEETPMEHYLSWSPIVSPGPDFHRPEFFGDLRLG